MTSTPPRGDSRRQAEVVTGHLPTGYTAGFDATTDSTGSASNSAPDLTRPEQESSLKLLGGDIHRDLYKISARGGLHKRSATFAHTPQWNARGDQSPTASEQLEPGGFRREFVRKQRGPFHRTNIPVTRNFVQFLDLYGSFAGEDLADSDDDSEFEDFEEDEDEAAGEDDAPNERRPLLGRRKSSKVTKKGDAGMTKTFFTLLKAFIGTGIMFLPKAFLNGGILFSSMTLLMISTVSMLAFHLLLECKSLCGRSGYGEIGESIVGPKMRTVILGSITLSQLGFVCAGMVFVAQNLKSFVDAVAQGPSPLSTSVLIALQLALLIPLSFIRNISKLGPAALLADVFILIGLTYIYYFDIATIVKQGIEPSVVLFNPAHYTLMIGSGIFTFEGIGLILPIQSSMKQPQKFEYLLWAVMLIITVIFTSVGALCYATFGSETQIEIIDNYPQTSKLVNAVQFLYSMAVLIGTPVQLFPAIRILENKIFGHLSGKRNPMTKWKKNGFRVCLVVLCALISILGSSNLDRFVALIGSFACVPLVYIYPPFLHYKGVAEKRWVKVGDVLFIMIGVGGMIFTTCVTVASSFMKG